MNLVSIFRYQWFLLCKIKKLSTLLNAKSTKQITNKVITFYVQLEVFIVTLNELEYKLSHVFILIFYNIKQNAIENNMKP